MLVIAVTDKNNGMTLGGKRIIFNKQAYDLVFSLTDYAPVSAERFSAPILEQMNERKRALDTIRDRRPTNIQIKYVNAETASEDFLFLERPIPPELLPRVDTICQIRCDRIYLHSEDLVIDPELFVHDPYFDQSVITDCGKVTIETYERRKS